jgi:hypothetical protein
MFMQTAATYNHSETWKTNHEDHDEKYYFESLLYFCLSVQVGIFSKGRKTREIHHGSNDCEV